MERLRERDLLAVLDFLRTANLARDLDTFRHGVTAGLARLVHCDCVTYDEIDPAGAEILWVTDPVDHGEHADRDAFLRNIAQHPVIQHHRDTGSGEALRLSDVYSRRGWHRTELYDEFFRPLEIETQVAMLFAAPRGVLVGVSLNRERRDFDPRERQMLDLLRPHLTQAYENAVLHTRLARVGHVESAAVVLLSPDGRIEHAAVPALERLSAWFGDGDAGDHLPEAVSDWLLGPARGEPLVRRRDDASVTLRFLPGRTPAEADVVLLEERRAAPAPADLRRLGLTAREAEVLSLVAAGATNAEIADTLVISPRTVKKHLEHIAGKLGTTNRAAAAARAHATAPAYAAAR
jgi:DNA-binding CsgD family transcriptional regulator